MNAGRLIARLTIGGLFVGHGTQKLFGWFDGPGPDGTAQMMDKLELRPPRRHALAAGLSETAGGALLALGALTPLAAALLSGTMFTAIRKVHLKNGLWVTQSGYEYNLALIAALAAVVDCGPGRPSVDQALGIYRSGSGWALASVAAGAAGSAIVIESGRQAPEQEQEQEAQPQANGRPERVPIAV
ncbi:MAG: putative oxidoreductase [Thermoleophilaceae bacterium]|jgi:putative oxidoreductase|nr:putative oxidoreductase [Thermoleophilaceae bacterium]